MPADACHACGGGPVRPVAGFAALPRVTSDAKPFPAGGDLGVCAACASVQKPQTAAWEAEAASIYAAYAIYHNAGGAEQNVFTSGGAVPASRSSRVVREFRRRVELPAAGRMLDLGCGNGAMLRAFGADFPGWGLTGSDLSDGHRAAVEAIGGGVRFFTGGPADVPGGFDVVTLVHVLEHVPDPVGFLRTAAAKLTPGGCLLIEVPDHRNNPFDLAVADHCTHFTPDTLRAVVEAAGLEVLFAAADIVPREITLAARPGAAPGRTAKPADATAAHTTATRHVRWLAALAEQGRRLAAGRRLGVFGTSIGAAWLMGAVGDGVRFFVDEDEAKVGRTWAGRPILRPAEAPSDAPVLLGLPDALAADIRTRLGAAMGADRLHLPAGAVPHALPRAA